MTRDEMEGLTPGDLVRHKASADAAIVASNNNGKVSAVRTYRLSNPAEWDIVDQAGNVISTP